MASPAPPPVADLLADLATWIDVPPDLPALLALLPRADLYLQDEMQAALHPTLTRVWSPKGRRGQRLIEAPGHNAKVTGFGALDWRDGYFHGLTAPGRRAQPLVDQLGALVERSRARGRVAIEPAPQDGLVVVGERSLEQPRLVTERVVDAPGRDAGRLLEVTDRHALIPLPSEGVHRVAQHRVFVELAGTAHTHPFV